MWHRSLGFSLVFLLSASCASNTNNTPPQTVPTPVVDVIEVDAQPVVDVSEVDATATATADAAPPALSWSCSETVRCLPLPTGATVAVQITEQPPENRPENTPVVYGLTIAVLRDGNPVGELQRVRIGPTAGVGDLVFAPIANTERTGLRVELEDRDHSLMRVGFVSASGEDNVFHNEFVLLFRYDPQDHLQRLWTGEGDQTETQMDSCLIQHVVHFRFTSPNTIDRTFINTSRFRANSGVAPATTQQLRRACRPANPRTGRTIITVP